MELLALIMSSLALAKSQQDYHLGVINPDHIYFNDGGQRYPYLNVLPVSQSPQPTLNPNIGENQQFDQGGRFPVNMIPQMGPNLNVGNMNVNPLKRPSQGLEPPHRPPLGNIQPTVQPTVLPQTADRFAEISDEATNKIGLQDDVATLPPTKISLALSQFGINLMKIVQQQSRNAVVSPYSIGSLLALLQQGSLGASQQQISNALQMNPLEAADGFKNLTNSLKKRQSHNIMKVGTGLFLAEGFSVNPAFKRVAMQDFDSDVATIKYSRPEQAATKINNWVASKTNNKINKLLSADSVGENTQLTLVNAVYFKGLWQVKFRPEATMSKSFYQYRAAPKMANFMRMRRYFRTDFDPSIDSQVLILPFEGDQYSLVVILPSPSSTVTSALAAMTPAKLLAYQNYTPKEVALELPKFSVKAETNLISVFQQLGITNIFGPTSELSGLGHYREFSPQVSSAVHSALLSVDEEGGTAAAATSFGVVALSYDDPSVTFRADRPFIAVLWDRLGSVPLFMAKIEDPY